MDDLSITNNELKYLSLYDTNTGKRITSYVTGVHGKDMEELKAKAASDFPEAIQLEQSAAEYSKHLNDGKVFKDGNCADPPGPTEEDLKEEEKASLASDYEAGKEELLDALHTAQLNGDDETVAEIQSEFADFNTAYKQAVEEVG